MVDSTLKSLNGLLSRAAFSCLVAATLATSMWSPQAAAETTGIFGPTTYTREAGPPQIFTAIFDRCGTAACQLIVTNGDANGNNIHLWECKGQPNQRWIYDGFSRMFRSDVNRK